MKDRTLEVLKDIRSQLGGLNERFDGLNERVDGLNERFGPIGTDD